MRQFLKFFSEFFGKLWFKFVVEICITAFLFITYYILRYFLPKKYQIKDQTVRDFYKKIAFVLTNMPNKDDNIFGIVGKARGVFSEFHDYKVVENADVYMSNFAKQNEGLDLLWNDIFLAHLLPHLEVIFKPKLIEEFGNKKGVYEYDFGEYGKLFACKVESYLGVGAATWASNYFAVSKGLNPFSLMNVLLDHFDKKMFIEYDKNNSIFSFQKLNHDQNLENYIPNEKLLAKFSKEITDFRKLGNQRSYILYGEPGTGKTTFAIELSRRLSNGVVKISSNVLTLFGLKTIKYIVENIKCDTIIVDDIDRINDINSVERLLYALETVKNLTNKPTLIATANNINAIDKAIIRPGRFDEIFLFKNPNKKERVQFIKTLLAVHKCTITKQNLEKFVNLSEGLTQAYIKEYCSQYVISKDINAVIKNIVERKKLLGMHSKATNAETCTVDNADDEDSVSSFEVDTSITSDTPSEDD